MTTYFIYENWHEKKIARIHVDECACCFWGRGVHKCKSIKNGKWHGPFASFAEAEAKAHALPDRTLIYCKHCNPQIRDK